MNDARQSSPAALRNRAAISAVLEDVLPGAGRVLEIASGSGEHAVYFAHRFPKLQWFPSDPSPDAVASIAAWRELHDGDNLHAPVQFAAGDAQPPIERADAIFCANMLHISPWRSAEDLFGLAARILGPEAPLVLYGPFIESERSLASSNADFDASLRMRNPAWGLRELDAVDRLAAQNGLARTGLSYMPANNLMLVYRPLPPAVAA